MRFYLKLFLMVGSFMGLVSATGRRMTGNLAFEARVVFVFTFGSEADRERLIEDTGRMRAIEGGYLEEYLSRERFLQERARNAQGSDPNDPDIAAPDEDPPDREGNHGVDSTACHEVPSDAALLLRVEARLDGLAAVPMPAPIGVDRSGATTAPPSSSASTIHSSTCSSKAWRSACPTCEDADDSF